MVFTEDNKKYVQEQIDKGFEELTLPPYMKSAVENWVFHGIPGGSFLTSIMTNNLKDSIFQADAQNRAKIQDWVQFITWHIPSACQGSVGCVNHWIQLHTKENGKEEQTP